jgi:1-acyl-sn-glycerol-3-phosphate acyltransferase
LNDRRALADVPARMRWLAYKGTVLFLRSLLAPFVRVRILHCERARVRGACILASNHISHFDPPLIAWCIPRTVDWMATLGLFSNRFIGAWLRYIDAYPVDRSRPDRATVRITLERLKLGRIAAIFPEGGIRDGAASVLGGAPPVPGPGALSQISGAPVLPCVILGTDRLYARRSYLPFRRVTVWIGFGELLRCAGSEKAERVALDQRLAEAMRALQREMSSHFQLTDDDLPKPPRERAATR